MAFVQNIHDFLTSCGELAESRVALPLLDRNTYLDCLLYAGEDACWAIGLVPVPVL